MLDLKFVGFNKNQTDALEYAWSTLGLSEEEMECIAHREYSASLMWQIIDYFEQEIGDGACEEFKKFYKPCILQGFNDDQIIQVFEGLNSGLGAEEVGVYAKHEFNDLQMDVLKDAFISGLSIDEVKTFADPNLAPQEMEECMESIWKNKNS